MEQQKKLGKLAKGVTREDLKTLYEYYSVAVQSGTDVDDPMLQKMAEAVMQSGDAEYNYKFAQVASKRHFASRSQSEDMHARYKHTRHMQSHGDAVINSGDAEYNYKFARDIKAADALAHGVAVIKSGDAGYNHLFALDVKGANKLAHGYVVINSGDAAVIESFKRDLPSTVELMQKRNDVNAILQKIDAIERD